MKDITLVSLWRGSGSQDPEPPRAPFQLTMEARMGRKSEVVATLLVHSVKTATKRLKRKAIAGWGMFCKGVSLVPNQLDRRDSWKKRVLTCCRRYDGEGM